MLPAHLVLGAARPHNLDVLPGKGPGQQGVSPVPVCGCPAHGRESKVAGQDGISLRRGTGLSSQPLTIQ